MLYTEISKFNISECQYCSILERNVPCTHDPRETLGPIGMYHCPECGEMVIAGMEHPDYSLLDNQDLSEEEICQ